MHPSLAGNLFLGNTRAATKLHSAAGSPVYFLCPWNRKSAAWLFTLTACPVSNSPSVKETQNYLHMCNNICNSSFGQSFIFVQQRISNLSWWQEMVYLSRLVISFTKFSWQIPQTNNFYSLLFLLVINILQGSIVKFCVKWNYPCIILVSQEKVPWRWFFSEVSKANCLLISTK